MLKKKIFSVGEIANFIKNLLERDELRNIWVEGEISDYRKVGNNCYFSLKDERASIKCVMFNAENASLREGMKVIVKGDVGVYEKRGYYQLYVREIKIGGIGEIFIKFLEMKEKLEKEGLFDRRYKKAIPSIPSTVGVITSKEGAAIHDIYNVISRRFPLRIVLAPVRVQGETAADEIVRAIEALNEREDVDVIILARGGGRWEDLQAFNEEKVARAIFRSRIPIISGVGHESDFTIADFVADVRAATPSAAAEMAVPDGREIMEWMDEAMERMLSLVAGRVGRAMETLEGMRPERMMIHAARGVERKRERCEGVVKEMEGVMNSLIASRRHDMEVLHTALEAMSPYRVLERGYSICIREKDNKVFSSIGDADIGDVLRVIVKDGEAKCRMEEKRRK